MQEDANPRFNWAGLPLIATIARLLCRELTLQNEYLRQENKILKSKAKAVSGSMTMNGGHLWTRPWQWAGS